MSTKRTTKANSQTTNKSKDSDLLDIVNSINVNDNEEIKKQQIFSANQFIEKIAAKYDNLNMLRVYFFHDCVKEITQSGGWNNAKTIYFHPQVIIVKMSDNKNDVVNMNELKEEFGDDFGIRFNISRNHKLNSSHKVNMLEINMNTQSFDKDGKTIEYHPSRTVLYEQERKLLDKIVEKYYKDAPKFEFTKTNINNSMSYADMEALLDKI